jgi:hypothetical protein
MSLIGCWKANNRDVLILKIVEDIREAFLEEIRCSATLAIGIPRRDSFEEHSLLESKFVLY